MNKRAFLERLKARLCGLPRREVEERISFYIEMIDDRIEDGLSEEEAVAAVGSVEKIAAEIAKSICTRESSHDAEPKKWRAWEIIVLVLGAPLWIPLLAAAFVIVLAGYAVVWSLNLAIWAVELPFFLFSYISKYLLIACKAFGVWSARLSKACFEKIKGLFSAE
jgi:uncharacterized membrane protein